MTPDALFAAVEARQESTFTDSYARQHFGRGIPQASPAEAADATSFPACVTCGKPAHGPMSTYCSECIKVRKNARVRIHRAKAKQ